MTWLKHYHEDHMAVMRLLAKLEGNVKEIEMGERRSYVDLELQEFAEVIEAVIRPHFQEEEKGIYAKIDKVSGEDRSFISKMLEEHQELYAAFDDYLASVRPLDEQRLAAAAKIIIKVLERHIEKEEKVVPRLARQLKLV